MKKISFLIASVCLAANAFSASFDCNKAKTSIEKNICTTQELSTLDDTLSEKYKILLGVYGNSQAIKQMQRDWVKQVRNICSDASCLSDVYRKRIDTFDSAINSDEKNRFVTGIYLRYLNGKKDPNYSSITVLALKDDKVLLDGASTYSSGEMVNTGELSGIGDISGGIVKFKDDDEICTAVLNFKIRDNLYVSNETGCGGMNVTFNGQYKK